MLYLVLSALLRYEMFVMTRCAASNALARKAMIGSRRDGLLSSLDGLYVIMRTG